MTPTILSLILKVDYKILAKSSGSLDFCKETLLVELPSLRVKWFIAISKLIFQIIVAIIFRTFHFTDFVNAKLLGHRFELAGRVDIVDHKNTFLELEFEKYFNRILEIDPENVNALSNIATAEYEIGLKGLLVKLNNKGILIKVYDVEY